MENQQTRKRPDGERALPNGVAQAVIDRYADGETQEFLLRWLHDRGYPVSLSTVRNILAGRTYQELKRPSQRN